jgi:hypothetical protein
MAATRATLSLVNNRDRSLCLSMMNTMLLAALDALPDLGNWKTECITRFKCSVELDREAEALGGGSY